jgi:hypothetical protein
MTQTNSAPATKVAARFVQYPGPSVSGKGGNGLGVFMKHACFDFLKPG